MDSLSISSNYNTKMLEAFRLNHLLGELILRSIFCFQTAIFTVLILPFRVMAIMLLLIMAWILACVGLMGLSEQELRQRPITGWRR
jgi:lysophosphatidylcholine acyltransferase/lyso-PAF acetyltransferase